ncbi:MAG: BrxA/BrxB family bacilliredoxin [Candidatus Sumerlaeia bacterium]|nr:BrxA/BrxB family bacilliredoxin [Candidatus Sumerlaeia bacterium]
MFFNQQPPAYDPEDVRPMREELVAVGIEELRTPADVDAALANHKGTALVVVNSVCGCAAGGARPGVALALQNGVIPDKLYTVFAGVDREATAKVRSRITNYPPSSPSVALFKDGEVVFMLERWGIEGNSPQGIAQALAEQFAKHCSATGPSVPPETFASLDFVKMCGSVLAAKAAGRHG